MNFLPKRVSTIRRLGILVLFRGKPVLSWTRVRANIEFDEPCVPQKPRWPAFCQWKFTRRGVGQRGRYETEPLIRCQHR